MRVSIIAAVADNGVIGRRGDLPWHLSADLKRFKRLTMGHHLLIGRRTFEAIGRPLPGRKLVVISRQRATLPAGVLLARSLSAAIRIAEQAGDDEAFVAGGAEIYALALSRADRLYLTRVHASFEGDTTFPNYDESSWKLLHQDDHDRDPVNGYAYSFLIFERRPSSRG
jgi:dihydrofolate reductase